jgi:hypothetical protein
MRKRSLSFSFAILAACSPGPKHAGNSPTRPLRASIERCSVSAERSLLVTIALENTGPEELYLGEGEPEPTSAGAAYTHEYSIAWSAPDFMFGASSSGTFLKHPPTTVVSIPPAGKIERVLAITEAGTLANGEVQLGLFWHDGQSDDPEEQQLRNACFQLEIESSESSCRIVSKEVCPSDG